MTITPCGSNPITLTIPLTSSGSDYSSTIIPICCPSGPTSCRKRKVKVCHNGVTIGADYKLWVLNIRDVNFDTYNAISDNTAKSAYLFVHMPIVDTRTVTTASGLLCIDYCLDAGNEQDYVL